MAHLQPLDLEDLEIVLRQEEEKRRNLENIPDRVAILARDYVHSGGDVSTLLRIITDCHRP